MGPSLEFTTAHAAEDAGCRRDHAAVAIIVHSCGGDPRAGVVAEWALDVAASHFALSPMRGRAELVDLAGYSLNGTSDARRWASAIAAYDGFVFVARDECWLLEDALDLACEEWWDKGVGLLGYGASPHIRELHDRVGRLRLAAVRTIVRLSLAEDFAGGGLAPRSEREADLRRMLDEVIAMSTALSVLRDERP